MRNSIHLFLIGISLSGTALAQKADIRAHSIGPGGMRQLPADCVIRRGILCDEARFPDVPTEQLVAGLANGHPRFYFQLAERLFATGDRDRATFWFYAGQLRYRFHLAAHPELSRGWGSDREEFGNLFETVGRPINEYAAGDIPHLTGIMQEVLDWDERTDNGFTSKTDYGAQWQETRGGLDGLRDTMIRDADTIRRGRTQNGLPNR